MAELYQNVRSYEISVWTLQDECITVLKPSELEFKGEVQSGVATFADDGTENLNFSIPMYYNYNGEWTLNPAWQHILDGHFTANMHKVKLIFNKATDNEQVYEMLITNVEQVHETDSIMFNITCEGLAFHELGKLGYKISLSSDDFAREYSDWFTNGSQGEAPHATISYWNDKIFKFSDGTLKYDWDYEIQMDWSGFSSGAARDPHKVYEEEYVSSWNVDPFEYTFTSKSVEGYREKWRQMDEEESNIYNLTQAIAEKFGVYCRYEYEHDVNYHITGKKVIYYNSAFREQEGYTDLTYPYNAAKVQRTIDNTDTITKLFVRPIESDSSSSNLISIVNVEGNPSKEDYLLNFDYLHDIHTITDEQYDQVEIYEGQLREINEQAVRLETQIILIEEELVKVRADYATYTKAISLDIERQNNASLLRQQLTGSSDIIEVGQINPQILVLKSLVKNSGSYYVDIPFDGVFPESVSLYTKLNYNRPEGEGRLEGLVLSGQAQFDEFNNLNKIINIYVSDSEQTRLYMTCKYSPKLYYDKVEQIWKQRLAEDTANQVKADLDIRSLELMLYSADVDYCHADYAVADASSVQVSAMADEINTILAKNTVLDCDKLKLDFNYRPIYMGEFSTATSLQHRGWDMLDTIYERNAVVVPFTFAGVDDRYVVVNPVLPGCNLLCTNNYSQGTGASKRITHAQELAREFATQYLNGEITMDTILPVNGNTYYKFKDIYIATTNLAETAQELCDAIEKYDRENLNTSCAFVGNATADYSFSDVGYTDKALSDEAHGYVALHEFLLEKKYKIVTKFEKWMGPALREGYWQADDYNDYGNKYSDRFIISNSGKVTYYGGNKPDLINFTWDTNNVFTGETEAFYEVGVGQYKEYYLMVDLRPYLDVLYNYVDDLCFVYYSHAFLEENDKILANKTEYERLQQASGLTAAELERYIALAAKEGSRTSAEESEYQTLYNRNNLTAEQMISYKYYRLHSSEWDDALARNEEAARHWFTVGSDCEFGFAWVNGTGYVPVLILTGMKSLTVEDKISIVAPRKMPFIGTVKTRVETGKDSTGRQYTEVHTDVINLSEYKPLRFINTSDELSSELHEVFTKLEANAQGENVETTYNIPHTIEYINNGAGDATIAYPRIRVNSLELKNNSNDILISVKGYIPNQSFNTSGYTLEYIKDYYVLVKLDKDPTYSEHKYFITIKPEIFIKYIQNRIPLIDINYTTSNANEAIYLDAVKVMKENAYPKVSYEVALNALNPKMIQTAYNKLRSIVHINDYELQLDKSTGYISKLTLDLDHPHNDTIEVKNYETKFEDLFSTIVAQSEQMRKNENTISVAAAAFAPGGTLYSSVLQESILKADLNYSFNQGKLTIDEDNGIWGTSDSGVIAFRGGGIFTATEKDENGGWLWNTGILPTGINADLITTGQLDTNRIRIYAGDKVAFQMNGEGIFAYKTYANDQKIIGMDDELAQSYQGKNDTIDALQYVTYNENGLFFTTKAGTKVVNKDKNDFMTIASDVDRVEISWNGLILRDWNNNQTLFADPETGNLKISGIVDAYAGKIGAWTITNEGFEGSYIKFVNSDIGRNNGIFLMGKSSQGSKTIQYNGTTYYAYNIVNDETKKIYYLNHNDNPGEFYTLDNNETVLSYEDHVVACHPTYTANYVTDTPYQVGTQYVNGHEEPIYTTLHVASVCVTNQFGEFFHNSDNSFIIYDGDTSTSSMWYRQLEIIGKANSDFVTYTTVSMLDELTGNKRPREQLILDSYSPTFSVYAADGEVIMNNGSIGPFKFNSEYITGDGTGKMYFTNLDNCYIENSTIEGYQSSLYGDLVLKVEGSSSSGQIKVTHVDGTYENFNVADMAYYQRNISAAQQIDYMQGTVDVDNRNVHVSATTRSSVPHGWTGHREIDIGVQSVYESGYNEGYGIGYSAGESAGYSSGYNTGYSAGESAGSSAGYSTGYSAGYSEGYSKGQDDGFIAGWNSGYEEGYHQGSTGQ